MTTTKKHLMRSTLGAGIAAAACAIALLPAAGQAACGSSETLRVFSKTTTLVMTRADGTVVRRPPFPEAKAGDVLDIYSLDYAGNHSRQAARFTGSEHLRCTFAASGPPACESHVAIGNSMLIFHGSPGTVWAGTGRYEGATGRVLSNKDVGGGSDVVARIRLR